MISGTSARLSAEIARQGNLSSDIAKLQDQISTGKRLGQPSDDPAGSLRVGAIRQVQADDTAFAANVTTAAATATRADAAMSSLSTSLDRARELMTQASSGTANADARAAAAIELRSMALDVAQLAATRDTNGQPLFPEGQPLAVPIGPGVQVAPSVSRQTLFGVTNADGTTTDIAGMLNAAADALGIAGDAARGAATAASLSAIANTSTQVADVHAAQGLRAARIDARGDAMATEQTGLATERSGIEDTDISAAITLITAKMTTLQAAQAVFAKVSRQTLFNVLG